MINILTKYSAQRHLDLGKRVYLVASATHDIAFFTRQPLELALSMLPEHYQLQELERTPQGLVLRSNAIYMQWHTSVPHLLQLLGCNRSYAAVQRLADAYLNKTLNPSHVFDTSSPDHKQLMFKTLEYLHSMPKEDVRHWTGWREWLGSAPATNDELPLAVQNVENFVTAILNPKCTVCESYAELVLHLRVVNGRPYADKLSDDTDVWAKVPRAWRP